MTTCTRYFAKVDKSPSGCWEWTAAVDRYGYGKFWDGTRKVKAHRWAYEHLVGPIPDGMQMDHLCRNRACVNPDHLEPVTLAENLRRRRPDMDANCVNGHPWTPESTYLQRGKYRECRICRNASARRSRAQREVVSHA